MTLANFEPQFGGIQWYVDQILGTGHDRELFYANSQAMQYYRQYVSTLVYRTNTFTGTQYKYDATILSWELLNEPHTTDNYEKNRGLQPGLMVRDWLDEMSTWLKGIDSNHLISSGEEGYRQLRQLDQRWIQRSVFLLWGPSSAFQLPTNITTGRLTFDFSVSERHTKHSVLTFMACCRC